LDEPVVVQYGYYLKDLFLHADLGISMKIRGRKVNQMISSNFPKSMTLGLIAVVVALGVGLPLGIIAGLNRGKTLDSVSMIIAVLGISVPSFIVGGTLQWLVLAIKAKTGVSILPIAGWGTWQHVLMPSFALAIFPIAVIARMMRASMIEVLAQDYIRTARSKGISNFKVTLKHGIRNAIMPVITYIGPLFAAITTGSFVIETVFAIPGLGRYFSQSILDRDYTVTLGVVVFYASMLIVMMILVDLAYGLVDPRIRVGRKRGA
jgi:ABC-type dipeptide/oligopeptide/nickel transport system permease component